MTSVISRTYLPDETIGTFIVFDGHKILLDMISVELKDLNNKNLVSCIPEGVYWIKKIVRPNGQHALELEDVPKRTKILIHIANYAAGKKIDLQGCIAPGMRFEDINNDGHIDAKDSTIAMKLLLNILPDRSQLHIIS